MAKNSFIFKNKKTKTEDFNLYLHLVAHEIRNPLVSIQGYTALLQEKYIEHLPPDGKEYLLRIAANLKRAETLLADITQLAEVSINESSFEKISAGELIDNALESHLLNIKKKKLQLTIQSNLPELFCDRNMMVLVFSNLIGNAIKYASDTREGIIDIGYIGDEIFHKFFVKDTGVGFKAVDRNKVFHLFSRLRNKRNVSGTGLGLSIVKQIIEGHGGEIWVESRKNRGTTFFFTLPKN